MPESSKPELLSKNRLNFGQGLEFLKFGQGNRGLNQPKRRKSKEAIRKNDGQRKRIDKEIRGRDPYFLFGHHSLPQALLGTRIGDNGSYQPPGPP